MTDKSNPSPDSDGASSMNPHDPNNPYKRRTIIPYTPTFTEVFILNATRHAISRTILAPIERIQLLLQCEGEMIKSGRLETKYRGIADCVTRTYRAEGARSLFRGNVASILPIFLTLPSTVAMDRFITPFFLPSTESSRNLKLAASIGVGCLAGVFNIGLVYHLDFVRTRLANDIVVQAKDGATYRQYSGMLDCYRHTINTDGFRGLYRGFFICSVGHVLSTGASVGVYEYQRKYGMSMSDKDRAWAWGIGVAAGVFLPFLAYPFDTLRRRMMMRSGEPVKYRGAMECFSRIYRKEGMRALWKGMLVNIVKTVSGIVVFHAMDLAIMSARR